MRTTLSTTLIALAVACLSACQPAEISIAPTTGPTPTPAVSYWLMRTQTNHPIPTTVDYGYRPDGRLTTSRSAPDADGVWKQLAPIVQYSYDNNQRLVGTEGTIIYRDAAGNETSRVRSHYGTFTNGDAGLPAAYRLFVNTENRQGRLFEERHYEYNGAGRVSQEVYVHYDENPAIGPLETRYQLTYTGDDVTSINITVSSGSRLVSTSQTVFDYDDKANPYYGLAAPELLPQYRYSRHNITRQTITSGTSPANVLSYKLSYAANGTLSRWDCSDGRYQTLTYESF
ncbi:hypothetical protein [Spirosoma rhododendri]|uniref:YD repeat-containing protein n=1 Tax=Spirosoma rhododendri TaxID=2728024 RepID=A0A7L5DI56_9BACT|nr:hypothetical protein [Spirosoma rhododendri]QJD77041.1 hypothetical protein HH216_00365 [Spirosoma rhododendri]